eukprot:Em0001g2451a
MAEGLAVEVVFTVTRSNTLQRSREPGSRSSPEPGRSPWLQTSSPLVLVGSLDVLENDPSSTPRSMNFWACPHSSFPLFRKYSVNPYKTTSSRSK